MRTVIALLLIVLVAGLLSACELWPRELKPLAESISRQVSGEVAAWRVGGDVVVIIVTRSPLFPEPLEKLEAVAADIAAQAVEFASVPLESVAITFLKNEVSEAPEDMREFVFLVKDGQLSVVRDLDVQRRVDPVTGLAAQPGA